MSDTDAIPSRRDLMRAGAALSGAALTVASVPAQAADPVDSGRVEGGRVTFPNWRGASDRPAPPPAAPLPPRERVGFAVVGLGRLSLEEILPAFGQTRKARPVALMSGTPDKAAVVADQYGIPRASVYGYGDWAKLAANPDVRAVYVVTPNGLHREHVVAAASAGKHVLCEKPMATNSADARAMIAACAQANVKLMIAYRCQYEVHNREVIRLVRAGAYGPLKLLTAVNTQTMSLPEQWRFKGALAGGGALPDIGLYCLNGARAITGEEPVAVQAQLVQPAGDPRYREVEESVVFTLRFPSGTLAQCVTSYGTHESRYLKVQTEGAALDLLNAFAYEGQRLEVARREGGVESIATRVVANKNQFALEIDHFADCVLKDRMPRTPGEEGLQDQVVMEAIYAAARGGGTVTLEPPAPVAGRKAGDRDVTRGPEPEGD
jgi:predicted dehydrogenase